MVSWQLYVFVLQVYELHNAGAVPVHYEVDAAVLSQLQMDNFNHPVLCCLNPEGEVLPGKLVTLEWIFSPLEAKMYHVCIRPYSTYYLLFYHCPLKTFILFYWSSIFYCRHHVSEVFSSHNSLQFMNHIGTMLLVLKEEHFVFSTFCE